MVSVISVEIISDYLDFPRQIRHNVHSICTANTYSTHAQSTSVRSMRVRPDHQTTGEGIVLDNYLVDYWSDSVSV